MTHNDDLLRWYVCTKKRYTQVIDRNDLDPNGCYFLLDTKEIYLDGDCYTGLFVFYSGNKPIHPAANKMYFNTATFETFIYVDGNWKKLFGVGDLTPISPDPNIEEPNDNTASGRKVADYVRRLIQESISDYSVQGLQYNENTAKLELVFGEAGDLTKRNVQITGIANKLVVDSVTHKLYVLDANNVVIAETVIFPRHIINGRFDIDTSSLIFDMSDGTVVTLASDELFKIFITKDTESMRIQTSLDGKLKMLSMEVRISPQSSHFLKVTDNGLYANFIDRIEKLQAGTFEAGDIIVAQDDYAGAKSSGYKIGGDNISVDSEDQKSRVVTEKALSKIANKILKDDFDQRYLKRSSVGQGDLSTRFS